jgi:hypothetical protein
MAPAPSKQATPGITGPRKRKASSKITDENFVGAESNIVTKRLKLSADAARADATRAAAAKNRQRQPSVQEVEDDSESEDTVPSNSAPKNPHAILEPANGSDDVQMLGSDPASPFEVFDEDDVGEEVTVAKPETAAEQRSESKQSEKKERKN